MGAAGQTATEIAPREVDRLLILPLLVRLVFAIPAPPQHHEAPPVVLRKAGDGEVSIPLRGRPHLLVFFSTWCRSCPQYVSYLLRMPELRRGNVQLVPIDVAAAELPGDPEAFWRRIRTKEPLYLDELGQIADSFEVKDLPAAVLIDRHGRIVATFHSAPSRGEIAGLLRKLG